MKVTVVLVWCRHRSKERKGKGMHKVATDGTAAVLVKIILYVGNIEILVLAQSGNNLVSISFSFPMAQTDLDLKFISAMKSPCCGFR